jgi:hypothetical protein
MRAFLPGLTTGATDYRPGGGLRLLLLLSLLTALLDAPDDGSDEKVHRVHLSPVGSSLWPKNRTGIRRSGPIVSPHPRSRQTGKS